MTTLDAEIATLVKKAQVEAAQPLRFGFWDLSDDGLVRVARAYRREIEDGSNRHSRTQVDVWLSQVKFVQNVRWCLRMRYGAVDDHVGTKSYDRYYRFGDAPGYSFALGMDRSRWELRDHPRLRNVGRLQRNILNWPLLIERGCAASEVAA